MVWWTDAARAPTTARPSRYALDGIAVVIPAHNEAQLLGRCLASLQRSIDYLGEICCDPPAVRIVVVLDGCTDDTADVAARSGAEMLSIDGRNVGAARRAGAHTLSEPMGSENWWLASTDADSVVPRCWLSAMTTYADAGADLVLGTVVPDDAMPARLARNWAGDRHLDGHGHVHGANLGIRVGAYRQLGGWPPLAVDEDVALVRGAEAAGLAIARSGSIAVVTSARLVGRAPGGFATALRVQACR